MAPRKDWLTTDEFAAEMGVSVRTVLRWLDAEHPVHGAIRRRRPTGAEYEIPAAEIDRLKSEIPTS